MKTRLIATAATVIILLAGYGGYDLYSKAQRVELVYNDDPTPKMERVAMEQEVIAKPVPLPNFQLTRDIDEREEYEKLMVKLAEEN